MKRTTIKDFFIQKKDQNGIFQDIEQKFFEKITEYVFKNKKKQQGIDEMTIERMKRGERVEINESLNKFFELFALKNRLKRDFYKKLRNKYLRPIVLLSPTENHNFGFGFIGRTEKETAKINSLLKNFLTSEGLRPFHAVGKQKDFGENYPGWHVWEIWPENTNKININYLFELAKKIGEKIVDEV